MNSSNFTLVMPTASTGRVVLLPSKYELSASLTEASFLASEAGTTSCVWISNPPHASYRLSEAYTVDAHRFVVVVWFSSSQLVAIELSLIAEQVMDHGWRNWDTANELLANQRQIDILTRLYGSHPATFSWGTIQSSYDPRGGGTSIMIRFAPAQHQAEA